MSTLTSRTCQRRAKSSLAVAVALAVPLALTACGSQDAGPAGEGEERGGEQVEAWEPSQDIEWIVPYSPGGGFDQYSRGVAQVMEEEGHLPDGVNIVVRNTTPTPQGITAMYTAQPDGHTVGILPMPAAVAQEIQSPEIAQWETEKFTVLASVDSNAYVVYVPADSPFQTIEDLMAAEDISAITVERGATSDLASQAAIEALGLDAELIYGAEGSAEVVAAALRGDVDFFVYGASDVVGFVESGDVRPLLFLGLEDQRSEELEWLQDVPNAEDAGVPDLAGTVTELRSIVAPPELPAEIAEYWRTALYETITSEAFEQWAADAGRPIVPRDHEATEEAMQNQIAQMGELLPRLNTEG